MNHIAKLWAKAEGRQKHEIVRVVALATFLQTWAMVHHIFEQVCIEHEMFKALGPEEFERIRAYSQHDDTLMATALSFAQWPSLIEKQWALEGKSTIQKIAEMRYEWYVIEKNKPKR